MTHDLNGDLHLMKILKFNGDNIRFHFCNSSNRPQITCKPPLQIIQSSSINYCLWVRQFNYISQYAKSRLQFGCHNEKLARREMQSWFEIWPSYCGCSTSFLDLSLLVKVINIFGWFLCVCVCFFPPLIFSKLGEVGLKIYPLKMYYRLEKFAYTKKWIRNIVTQMKRLS